MHSAHGTVRTMATVSARNASASSAARSAPSSGMRRVFTDPAIGGLAKMQTMASGTRIPVDQDYGWLWGDKSNLLFHAAGRIRSHFFAQCFFCDAAQPPYQNYDC